MKELGRGAQLAFGITFAMLFAILPVVGISEPFAMRTIEGLGLLSQHAPGTLANLGQAAGDLLMQAGASEQEALIMFFILGFGLVPTITCTIEALFHSADADAKFKGHLPSEISDIHKEVDEADDLRLHRLAWRLWRVLFAFFATQQFVVFMTFGFNSAAIASFSVLALSIAFIITFRAYSIVELTKHFLEELRERWIQASPGPHGGSSALDDTLVQELVRALLERQNR